MGRVYFHIDLNAFYANAEVLLDPSLKGKPLVVSGLTSRSVVSTSSYEARKYGIHSAMPIGEALRLCKDLIVIEGHYSYYNQLSEQFINIIKTYTDLVEQASVDECYADMTEVIKKFNKPLDLAWHIQHRVLKEVGIPCSIGIGPNMFLAKMASDMKKPMGITVLRIRDVEEKMWPLPIGDLRGIGKKTVPLLNELNIYTIGDLARYQNKNDLQHVFGNHIEDIINKCYGKDDSELITEWDRKSIGISETFLDDINDYSELKGKLRILAARLSKRMIYEEKSASHITLRICYYDFRNVTRSSIIKGDPIFKSEDIFLEAIKLFDEYWEDDEPVRLLGISMKDFAVQDYNLFNIDELSKYETASILDDLNSQLGSKGFIRASTLIKKNEDR